MGFCFTETEPFIFKEKKEMMYLRKTSDAQSVFIPKDRDVVGNLFLQAKSMIGQTPFTEETLDVNTSARYHRISVRLGENVQSGEYEYTLSDEKGVLSTGILIIGDSIRATEYNKPIEYRQYE